LLISGTVASDIKISLIRALSGFFTAAAIGVPLGLFLGAYNKWLFDYVQIPFDVLSQLNPFLLFHIIILFLGIEEAPKITIVAWTCLWPIVFSTLNGIRGVNPALIKSGYAFGLSPLKLISKIYLPASLGCIFAGLRLALGYSLFMLIAAEMMGASSGLGFLVLDSQETFQLQRMYCAVLFIAILGLILDAILNLIGRHVLPLWKNESTNTSGD
jgi:NitT/TauT family transport system permease protein